MPIFWLIAGNSLELIILNYNSDIYNGESNYLSIVKSNKIGQSAAKFPIYGKKFNDYPFIGVRINIYRICLFGNTKIIL